MKNILVPVDFSDTSMNAVETARQLALKTKASLRLLHVGEFTTHDLPAKQIRERQKKLLHDFIHDQGFKSLDIAYDEIDKELIPALEEAVENPENDLIVSGATTIHNMTEIMTGSVAEKIVRHASCPVLTVHQALDIDKIKCILLPSDLTEEQDSLLKPLQQLQQLLQAQMHLLFLVTPSQWFDFREIDDRLQSFVQRNKLSGYQLHSLNTNEEEDAILYLADKLKADLIAMGTHSRKGLAHFFKGSLTEELISHTRRAVWTCTLKK